MFRLLRVFHRWFGLVASLFLLTISITGFLLATKSTFGWVRPPERDGARMESLDQAVSVHQAADAAFSVGLEKLARREHIDRIDYRPKSNVFKVVSKEGYHEVQVCGATGKVLQVASRNDQLSEDIHDLSFLHDSLNKYWLPIVACALAYLSLSGIAMFLTPVFRRWKFKRKRASSGAASAAG